MNLKDLQIVSDLRRDARSSIALISKNVDMPTSTIYDKINRFKSDKIIKKCAALVDFPKLGFNHHAKIAMKIDRNDKENLFSFLKDHSCINSLHEINHGFDFFIETIHRDIKHYSDFVELLKSRFNFFEFHEYRIINELKREDFLF